MTGTDELDIDRQNLAAAKLRGILTDLKMDTTQFATAIAILYGKCPSCGACVSPYLLDMRMLTV
jgi:epoxyqueuosine reductase QueG